MASNFITKSGKLRHFLKRFWRICESWIPVCFSVYCRNNFFLNFDIWLELCVFIWMGGIIRRMPQVLLDTFDVISKWFLIIRIEQRSSWHQFKIFIMSIDFTDMTAIESKRNWNKLSKITNTFMWIKWGVQVFSRWSRIFFNWCISQQ